MGFLFSNLAVKLLIGASVVVMAVGMYEGSPGDGTPCALIESVPYHSAVYQCPHGLNTVALRNGMGHPVYTTVTTSVQTEAWLTTRGDVETLKTLTKRLGAASVLGPGAFMAIPSGKGLIYVHSTREFLLSVAWDVKTHR